jgi:hypothetical protein
MYGKTPAVMAPCEDNSASLALPRSVFRNGYLAKVDICCEADNVPWPPLALPLGCLANKQFSVK